MQKEKPSGERNTTCEMIHVEKEACDTSVFGLSTNLWWAYILVCRAVPSSMWACAELTEQLWSRLQVKDESSPMGRHQSVMDWHIWEKRVRDRRRARREQTTNTLLHCWALTLWRSGRVISVQPSQAYPNTYCMNLVRPQGTQDMMQCMTKVLTVNTLIPRHILYFSVN